MAVKNIIFQLSVLITLSFSAWANDIAPPPKMILPVECEVGWNCWVANYVDHERSEGSKDYACGNQTYNAHKGTDFIIRNYRDMQGGVIVRAASDGIVVGTRDGMKDIDYRKLPKEALAKKDCGNGVRIDHGDGWFTQYCHMRKNSIKVAKGDAIAKGDVIGLVGHSGRAALPHLHFQVEYAPGQNAKRTGSIVDPFVGLSRKDQCRAGEQALWPTEVVNALEYRQVDIFDVGFSTVQPTYDGLVEGIYDDETLPVRAPRLFLWGRFLHVKEGDRVTFRVTGPQGEEVLNYTSTIEKDQAYRFLHVGVRRPTLNWNEGTYQGEIKLVRADGNGGRIYRAESSVSMR